MRQKVDKDTPVKHEVDEKIDMFDRKLISSLY